MNRWQRLLAASIIAVDQDHSAILTRALDHAQELPSVLEVPGSNLSANLTRSILTTELERRSGRKRPSHEWEGLVLTLEGYLLQLLADMLVTDPV